jgi:hypothetical protein
LILVEDLIFEEFIFQDLILQTDELKWKNWKSNT